MCCLVQSQRFCHLVCLLLADRNDNGGLVWVNRGADDWNASEHVLPEYGYYARVPSGSGEVESAIERREGAIVEWSRSFELWYVNARPVVLEPLPRRSFLPSPTGPDPRPGRMNRDGKAVSFGPITTNGALRLTSSGDGLLLTPLPSSPFFTVRLRWSGLPWKMPIPREVEAIDESGMPVRRAPVEAEGDTIVMQCEPGVFAYRLR